MELDLQAASGMKSQAAESSGQRAPHLQPPLCCFTQPSTNLVSPIHKLHQVSPVLPKVDGSRENPIRIGSVSSRWNHARTPGHGAPSSQESPKQPALALGGTESHLSGVLRQDENLWLITGAEGEVYDPRGREAGGKTHGHSVL